jgi:sugar lactone lactonase YvrE
MKSSRKILPHTVEWLDVSSITPSDKLYEPKLIVDCKLRIGECPLWDEQTQTLFWIGCNTPAKLFMLQTKDGKLTTVSLPREIGSIAFCKSGVRLLMALDSTFAFFYLDDFSIEELTSSYKRDSNEGSRLNDGRVDRMGRFVVGGLNFIFGGQKLYSVTYEKEKELQVKTLPVPDMKCANSICFTTDGRFMYHADTPTHKI